MNNSYIQFKKKVFVYTYCHLTLFKWFKKHVYLDISPFKEHKRKALSFFFKVYLILRIMVRV